MLSQEYNLQGLNGLLVVLEEGGGLGQLEVEVGGTLEDRDVLLQTSKAVAGGAHTTRGGSRMLPPSTLSGNLVCLVALLLVTLLGSCLPMVWSVSAS